MPPVLPKPIAAYFAADAGNGAAVADCFTADAVVVDERQTYRGRDTIARKDSNHYVHRRPAFSTN